MADRGTGADKLAFVARLQTILAHWPSADRLARAMGVSPSAFRKWLKGEAEPSRERLVALARATGVGIAWLAEGEGPAPAFEPQARTRRATSAPELSNGLDRGQFVLLPKMSRASNGADGDEFLALRHDWVRLVCRTEPDSLTLETATGEAMAPTIRDGDLILIDTADRVCRNSGIYVVEVGGDHLARRVQRKQDGSLVLISDNPVYQHDTLNKEAAEAVVVVGRVVWSGGSR